MGEKGLRGLWKRLTSPLRALGKALSTPFGKLRAFLLDEPEEAPLGDSVQLAFDQPDSFLEHVGALRKHLLRSLAAFLICAAAAFIFLSRMLDFLTIPVGGLEQLQAIEVTEPISVAMRGRV